MQVGVAGLGKMGAEIAARLIEVGHQVTVWNRSADKTKPLAAAGAKVVNSPAEVAKASEAVITILADGKAIDDVYSGANGLLSGDVKGKLFIEMSTELPSVKVALAEKVRAKGAALVDCPVGGSTKPAREGKLLGLVGGEAADIARARPILEQLCGQRLEECGGVGGGSAVKLAINLPLMVAWQAYGEAFAIVRDLGWEPKKLLDLFVNTNGANNAMKMRGADDGDDVRRRPARADHVQHFECGEGHQGHARGRQGQGRRYAGGARGARGIRGSQCKGPREFRRLGVVSLLGRPQQKEVRVAS